MARLTRNLTSRYLEAANRLRPTASRRRIVAYVESYDDIAFWRTVLQEFEDDTRYFEVRLPGTGTLSKGKRKALAHVLSPDQLGGAMIACVDADYDWLLADQTETSRFVNSSSYVVHTFVYAIESYQCYAPALHQAVVTATLNDRPTLSFETFFADYSRIIWPLFVWNVWCYTYERYHSFSMSDMATFITLERHVNIQHPEQMLEVLRRRVNQKIAWLQHRFPEGRKTYPRLRQRLLDQGLTPDTTYLYIQGHTLMENVVLPLLDPICIMLRKEREREIRQYACHDIQRQNELSSYQHSLLPIDVAIRKTTAFTAAPQMEWVRQRLCRMLDQTQASSAAVSSCSAVPSAAPETR